jgi:hypothetical protein
VAEDPGRICGAWDWDPVVRELRHFPRKGRKGFAGEPDMVERLPSARSVSLHKWSQQPMQSATGEMMSARQGRVVVEYEDGRKLEVNEDDRECASRLADAIATAFGVVVSHEGAPSGRRGGNLPARDEMGRWVHRGRKLDTVLDTVGGTLTLTRRKSFGRKDRREARTSEIRSLRFRVTTEGANEVFAVDALVGPEEDPIAVAGHTALEGWADIEEWRRFTDELARELGVEARTEGTVE